MSFLYIVNPDPDYTRSESRFQRARMHNDLKIILDEYIPREQELENREKRVLERNTSKVE